MQVKQGSDKVSSQGSSVQDQLAVLIDADNAQASLVEPLLAEITKYGTASVKRIYGDWTTPNLGSWKTTLLEHSIQPIQQFRYTVGKNATDSALIIDAMDLLHSGRFAGFCLVSSDSDFTRLASRIREEGLLVYGFGERKTPKPFVSACDKFIFVEVLAAQLTLATPDKANAMSGKTEPAAQTATTEPIPGKKLRMDTRLVNLFRSAIEATSDDDGWAGLGPVGSNIVKQAPEFDSRNYGYQKLSELASAIGLFDVDRKSKVVYIRNTKPKPAKQS